jgi:hypothetical protein
MVVKINHKPIKIEEEPEKAMSPFRIYVYQQSECFSLFG